MSSNKKRPPTGGKSGGGQELTIVASPDSNTPEARAQVILAEEAQAPSGDDMQQQVWRRYVRVARNWRRSGKLEKFEEAFAAGNGPKVEFPGLLRAAIALTRVNIGAAVPPLPTEGQLADVASWIEDVVTEHERNSQNTRWARELRGLPRNADNGKSIGPARLQKSKYPPEELLQRLRFVIAQHDEKLGGFEFRYLDHKSRYYINNKNGGISNKQLVFLANFITGNTDERSTEAVHKIVADFLVQGGGQS